MKKILYIANSQDGGNTTPATAPATSTAKKSKSAEASPTSTEATAPAPADGAAPEPVETEAEIIERLNRQVAELQGKLNTRSAQDEELAKEEEIIKEKMSHGLSRSQAQFVIRRQKEFDARIAERRAKIQAWVDEELPEGLSGKEIREAIRTKFNDASSNELRIRKTGSKTWD